MPPLTAWPRIAYLWSYDDKDAPAFGWWVPASIRVAEGL